MIKYNEDIADCVNVVLPTSCDDFTELEIENLKHYNEKRLLQHNNRRALHYSTPDLEFSLDLACQALEQAKSALEAGNLDYQTGLDSASPP